MTDSPQGRRGRTPLYIDTFALCEWLLNHLDTDQRTLARAICDRALILHEAILLALRDRQRLHELERADDALIVLRSELRLAASIGQLSESQVVYALDRADGIGRQLGN